MVYEVWQATTTGGWTLRLRTRRKWWARLFAWEHNRRGWFRYEVREASPPAT